MIVMLVLLPVAVVDVAEDAVAEENDAPADCPE